MGMRGLETPVRKIRRQVFREVSKVAFESTSENLIEEIEEIPISSCDGGWRKI